MGRRSGYVVTTKSGAKGITYHDEAPTLAAQNKLIVHLVDEDFNPLTDELGKPRKVISDPANLKVIGFVD